MKKILTIVKPVLRGIIKVVPLGTAVVESVQNVQAANANTSKPVDDAKPHDWISIATQVIAWGVLIYAFTTKAITLDQLFLYLGING